MTRDKTAVSLSQMLDYAREISAFVQDVTFAEFERDRMRNLAVIRLIEIIGEAANRISLEFQQNHPEISWREIINMRKRLLHGYDVLALEVVWSAATEDIPPLIKMLEIITETYKSD